MVKEKTVRVGWLQQDVGIFGGAEFSCKALVENAPEGVEVVYCPEYKRPPRDVDVFVIQNCTTYSAKWIEELALKPVVKQIRDPWYAGNPILRRWLLENSEVLIFSSPTQADHFRYETDLPYQTIPVPIDLDEIKAYAKPEEERKGNVFVGRAEVFKGVMYAVDWALEYRQPLDIVGEWEYGYVSPNSLGPTINVLGKLEHDEVLRLLGKRKRFVFFPTWVEAFGRTVVEAWAAGCELVVSGNIGALWWIQNEPERLGLEGPIKEFWDIVESVC